MNAEVIKQFFANSKDIQSGLLYSVIILAIVFLIRWIVVRIINKRIENIATRYRCRKIVTYGFTILSFILIISLWFKDFQPLMTFLGLFSAGLAIALRDLIANLVGWFFILIKRPFRMGDRIQVGDVAGDVIDIRIFNFSLMEIGEWVEADQSTGRVLHVPNSKVLTESVANFTTGFEYIWNEIPVLITFESDWERAKEILVSISNHHTEGMSSKVRERVRQASRKFMIKMWKNLTPYVWTSVRENGVLLTIRYLCHPHSRRTSEESIWEDILRAFREEEEIEFAYPTQRLYNKELQDIMGKKKKSQE